MDPTVKPKLHNHYSKLPIIAAVTWYVTLFILLITYLASGTPHYASQDGNVAYISDVAASFLKPLFVVGACITAVTFVLTLASERLLQHVHRLLPARRRSEKVLSYCAIGGAAIGGLGLILLSILDTLRHTTLHRVFLFVFMLGVTLSAIFTVVEYRMLSHTYDSYAKLRRTYIAKGLISAVLVVLAFIFGGLLGASSTAGMDVGAILEWVIAFLFNFYLLTFWYDLKQAAPRNDVHEELKKQERSRAWWRV